MESLSNNNYLSEQIERIRRNDIELTHELESKLKPTQRISLVKAGIVDEAVNEVPLIKLRPDFMP
jgi:hypothetical protein